nr:histidine-rich glycoprotein [Bactrocera oleae]
MLKFILLSFACLLTLATALKIHDFEHHEYEHHKEPEESEHHHEVEHKHATSHQSVKFHHFHPVPVYIKDKHLLKNPIEIGGTKQKLKILHPKTEHSHNYGLVLEEESESHIHEHGHHEIEHHEPHLEHYEHYLITNKTKRERERETS